MTEVSLPALAVRRATGQERFRNGNAPLPFDLLSFWQWSASDLVSNALRGRLAEFLVAQVLGIADGVRAEWDSYDLRTPSGLTVEVKSAAYVQSWAQEAPSAICFDIAPTRYWDAASNVTEAEIRRQARVYVFALLAHKDKATIDPLDVSQWSFYVLPTAVLNERLPVQKQIGLAGLVALNPVACPFEGLQAAIEGAVGAA
jgi:hypothetical protein